MEVEALTFFQSANSTTWRCYFLSGKIDLTYPLLRGEGKIKPDTKLSEKTPPLLGEDEGGVCFLYEGPNRRALCVGE